MPPNHIAYQQILERISRHCPDALSVYLQCLNRMDEKGCVFFPKRTVVMDMSEGWTKFLNKIKKLALEDLLEWHLFDQGISVTLAAIDGNE